MTCFDAVTQVITGGISSVTALKGSTEEEQFDEIFTQKEEIAVAV